jgi:hypothetical protein
VRHVPDIGGREHLGKEVTLGLTVGLSPPHYLHVLLRHRLPRG